MTDRQYTTQQAAFLEALFQPGIDGDVRKAMNAAGYGNNTPTSQVVKSLKKEITEATLDWLASRAPRAAIKLDKVLDDPSALGNPVLIKAAESILNRAGAAEQKGVQLDIPENGLVILPAKNLKVVSENDDA